MFFLYTQIFHKCIFKSPQFLLFVKSPCGTLAAVVTCSVCLQSFFSDFSDTGDSQTKVAARSAAANPVYLQADGNAAACHSWRHKVGPMKIMTITRQPCSTTLSGVNAVPAGLECEFVIRTAGGSVARKVGGPSLFTSGSSTLLKWVEIGLFG